MIRCEGGLSKGVGLAKASNLKEVGCMLVTNVNLCYSEVYFW